MNDVDAAKCVDLLEKRPFSPQKALLCTRDSQEPELQLLQKNIINYLFTISENKGNLAILRISGSRLLGVESGPMHALEIDGRTRLFGERMRWSKVAQVAPRGANAFAGSLRSRRNVSRRPAPDSSEPETLAAALEAQSRAIALLACSVEGMTVEVRELAAMVAGEAMLAGEDIRIGSEELDVGGPMGRAVGGIRRGV